jgi:hypothetical protein
LHSLALRTLASVVFPKINDDLIWREAGLLLGSRLQHPHWIGSPMQGKFIAS